MITFQRLSREITLVLVLNWETSFQHCVQTLQLTTQTASVLSALKQCLPAKEDQV